MSSRWKLTIVAALAALITLLVLQWQRPADRDTAASFAVSAPTVAPGVGSAKTPARPAVPRAPVAGNDSAGAASGSIHFTRAAEGAGPEARIDMDVKIALGVWQPSHRRLRILLLESVAPAAQLAQLASLLASDAPLASTAPKYGVIDLRFAPQAQAFDRNDLESASLTASSSGDGLESTADVLSGLDWQGSLPSPQASPGDAPAPTQIELITAGTHQSSNSGAWMQRWHVSISVPVSFAE